MNIQSAHAAFARPFGVRRRAVIIAGMHRSGTSALTRVLTYCGLGMPRTLVPPDEGNTAGHWESELVCRLNDALLARMDLDWISAERAPLDLAHEGDYADLLRQGSEIILEEYGEDGDIVLKDPRIARLLPFWLDVLAQLAIEPLIVLALRAPDEVALSLKRRNAILEGYGQAWQRFTLEAERASRHVPRVVVGFDLLMQDWRAVALAINRRCADELLATSDDVEQKVSAFLSPDQRHFSKDSGAHIITPAVTRTYAIMSQWQRRGERAQDHAELDAIGALLDEAPPIYPRYSIPHWITQWRRRQIERLRNWSHQTPGFGWITRLLKREKQAVKIVEVETS